jgi:cysteine desulfurase/selenocysteine lyase
MTAIREYEQELSAEILRGWETLPDVPLFGVREPERAGERVPTFAFESRAVATPDLEAHLWALAGLQVAAGSHYSAGVLRGLGRPSIARASFAHYNSVDEAATLIEALGALDNEGLKGR